MSSARSSSASLMSSISFSTDPPSSTDAVALDSPFAWIGVTGVAGVEDSSASRRSTSFLAFSMFYFTISIFPRISRKLDLPLRSVHLDQPSSGPTWL